MEAYAELEEAMKMAAAGRTSGIVCVRCQHCHFANQFPAFEEVNVFIWDERGEPVQ